MSASWIHKLNESDSRLHKEAVLASALNLYALGNEDAERFLWLTNMTYNPFVTWGVRQVPSTEDIVDAENPWGDFKIMLDSLRTRHLTGNAARDSIAAISLRFDSDEWNTLCAPVLRKDLRAGISDKTFNKVCGKTDFAIPVFGCQLASDCTDRPEMCGVKRLEPKLDGVRVLMMVSIGDGDLPDVATVCYSRNGKVFDNFKRIELQVSEGAASLFMNGGEYFRHDNAFILDGEVVGRSFNELMRQARRKNDVDTLDSVFHVFDVIPLRDFLCGHWNVQLEKRVKILKRMRPTFDRMPNVRLLPSIEVDLDTAEGKDVFKRYCEDQVAAGFEGVMVKELQAPYECKRNKNWLKYKPTITVDLEVIDLEEGTGKNAGRLGALVCSGQDDGRQITVNCGSGFRDDDRDSLWRDRDLVIGRTVEDLADAVSVNQDGTYSLRFPRFLRFRDTLTGEKE
jgi:DNA ligase-1